ncbi:MAG TPA: hypothetical protein VIJ12_08490 [Candidatus Baltobacteraceae bacterium]
MSWWRRLLAATLIGSPTALLAHALTYGREHVLGGSHHENVVSLALGLACVAVLSLGILSLTSVRAAQTGSILAARLAAYLPAWSTLAAMTAFWFAAIEGLEPQHEAGALLPAVVAIVACAWLVSGIARAIVRAFAKLTFAIFASSPARREIPVRRTHRAPIVLRACILDRRRFARPPPSFV